MRYLVLILIFAFVGCGEDKPTQNDDNKILDEEKYTIDELEQNPDWVEITDIDTLDFPCIWTKVVGMGKICRNIDEFQNLYDESKSYRDHSLLPCNNDSNNINVNFNSRNLILYHIRTGGQPNFERKMFVNDNNMELRYVLKIEKTDVTKEGSGFAEAISIPKISQEYNVRFDTLMYYKEY